MLHDAVMSRVRRPGAPRQRNAAEGGEIDGAEALLPGAFESTGETCLDRRQSDRIPFPAEMVMVWNHDFDTPMRYRVIDAGDGGYRIHSSLPLQEGMTGMVLRLLPSRGQALDQPVMVAWSRATEEKHGFEVGLRCF
jgi:hypothetical protein